MPPTLYSIQLQLHLHRPIIIISRSQNASSLPISISHVVQRRKCGCFLRWNFIVTENIIGNHRDLIVGVLTAEQQTLCQDRTLAVFERLKMVEDDFLSERSSHQLGGLGREEVGVGNCGSVHECVVEVLEARGLVVRKTVPTFKFVSSIADLSPIPELPSGLNWADVRREDIGYILTKTSIPRKQRTMKTLPSAAIIDEKTGSLAGWAFLGVDASLTHLYVEEAYRNRGLAKALSLKLYREGVGRYSGDGFAHADVEVDKLASQAVAKGLGGIHMWTVYWTWIRFSAL